MNCQRAEAAITSDVESLDITLPFAIADLGGTELLAAGCRLDETIINDIAEAGRQKQFKTRCLLQHGNIVQDIERFVSEDPYAFIFGGTEGIRKHISQFGEIPIPEPLLAALDVFKRSDYYTYRHSLVVFALTSFMIEKCYPGTLTERNILLVGPTHDVGKLTIPPEILQKKTPLTRRERQFLEFHSVAGYVLLSYYLGDHRHPAAHVALNHHERCNGSGYPRGISAINPLVEMVAICDIYDALISSRPYRKGDYDNRTALEELCDIADAGALGRFCVKALIGRNRAGHPAPEEVRISAERRGTAPESNCHSVTVDE
jgi:HD-GYP domain-containing protein (c-di-GMP phosphodiesterase class II)